MTREIIWTWAAEVDAQTAFARLEDGRDDAGAALVRTIDRILELLQAFPMMAAMWRPPVRRALLKNTHYGLFYVVEPQRLVVIALQDVRQDPAALEREIRNRLP